MTSPKQNVVGMDCVEDWCLCMERRIGEPPPFCYVLGPDDNRLLARLTVHSETAYTSLVATPGLVSSVQAVRGAATPSECAGGSDTDHPAHF